MSMNYNDFARAVDTGLFPREYVRYGLANEGRNYYMPDMYRAYQAHPVQPMVNPQLQRAYQDFYSRFPEGTDEQFMNTLRRNNPQLLRQAQQSITPENLARMAKIRGIGRAAANILGKGLKAIGPIGDIIYYGTLPMRKDEILKEYNMYIDDNGNITGRV